MTRPYDATNYDPPAPVFDAFLSPPGDPETRIWALALVDTGADISTIGPGIASRLGLPLVGQMLVAGIDDEPHTVPVWRVTIDTTLAGQFDVELVEIGGTTIVGRDILNQLSLHFDGPKRMLRIAS